MVFYKNELVMDTGYLTTNHCIHHYTGPVSEYAARLSVVGYSNSYDIVGIFITGTGLAADHTDGAGILG